MSLTTNTTALQSILDAVNALPEAGSGGGASIDTCSISFSTDGVAYITQFIVTVLVDGAVKTSIFRCSDHDYDDYYPSLSNVVCGTTIMMILGGGSAMYGNTISGGGERVFNDLGDGSMPAYYLAVKMPATAGSQVSVYVYDND